MKTITRTLAAVGTAAVLAGSAFSTQANAAATPTLNQTSFREAGYAMRGHSSSTRSEDLSVDGMGEERMVNIAPGVSHYAKVWPGDNGDGATIYWAEDRDAAEATATFHRVDDFVEGAEQPVTPGGQWGYDDGYLYRGTNGGEVVIRVTHNGDGAPAGARLVGHNANRTFNLDVHSVHGASPQQLNDLAQSALNDAAVL